MKTKNDIGKFKAFVVALSLLTFFSSGWILFVFSKIDRQKEMARELNLQTEEILNQMHRRDSTFTSESSDPELFRK